MPDRLERFRVDFGHERARAALHIAVAAAVDKDLIRSEIDGVVRRRIRAGGRARGDLICAIDIRAVERSAEFGQRKEMRAAGVVVLERHERWEPRRVALEQFRWIGLPEELLRRRVDADRRVLTDERLRRRGLVCAVDWHCCGGVRELRVGSDVTVDEEDLVVRAPRQEVHAFCFREQFRRAPAEDDVDETVLRDDGLVIREACRDVRELDAVDVERPVARHRLRRDDAGGIGRVGVGGRLEADDRDRVADLLEDGREIGAVFVRIETAAAEAVEAHLAVRVGAGVRRVVATAVADVAEDVARGKAGRRIAGGGIERFDFRQRHAARETGVLVGKIDAQEDRQLRHARRERDHVREARRVRTFGHDRHGVVAVGRVARHGEEERVVAARIGDDGHITERRDLRRIDAGPHQVLRRVVVDVVGLISRVREFAVEAEAGGVVRLARDGVVPIRRIHVGIEEDPALRSAERDAPA